MGLALKGLSYNFYQCDSLKHIICAAGTVYIVYCRFGNFRVFKISRISDCGTFHEV